MDAIGKDEHGRAQINYDKCVNCGMCLVNCPFGAIVDKGQLFQLIHAIRGGDKVIAIIAPAFWGQFGEKVTPGQIKAAMKQLGFAGLEEVAVGADLCAIEEAEEFLRVVPEKQPFMATSCCPAWSVMAKEGIPRLCALYLHDHDPHGADGPALRSTAIPAARSPSSAPAPPRSWRPAAAASAAMWILC